jgi:hypothetical protein
MPDAALLPFPDSRRVACTQCGCERERARMTKVEITPPGEQPLVRWLCPPHAVQFRRAWYSEVGR